MVTRRGASGPTDLPGYPEETSDENGNWQIVERYWVDSASVGTSLPAHNATINQHGTTVTDRNGNTLKCRRRNITQGASPDIRTVELTYALTSTSLRIVGPADNPRTVRLAYEETPIDDGRLLDTNGGPFTQAEIDTYKEKGREALALPVAEYTYTELDAAFDWTETNITQNLFANNLPTDVTGTTLSKWRLTGREIDETEEDTIIRTTWEYCNSGWEAL